MKPLDRVIYNFNSILTKINLIIFYFFFFWNSLWKFKKKEWTIFRERVSDFSEVSFERIRLWISISLELRIWLKNFNRLTWSDWNDSLAMNTLARDTSFLNPREVNWFGSWLDEVNHRRGNHRFPPVYFHMHVRATSLHAAAARRVLLFPKEFAHVRGCVTYARAPWNFKRARRKQLASRWSRVKIFAHLKIIVIILNFIFVSSREESNFWGGKTLPSSISRKLKFYEFCSRVGTRLIEKWLIEIFNPSEFES